MKFYKAINTVNIRGNIIYKGEIYMTTNEFFNHKLDVVGYELLKEKSDYPIFLHLYIDEINKNFIELNKNNFIWLEWVDWIIIDEFGEVTKENFKQLQEIAKERGYFNIVDNKYAEYKKLFKSFIDQFNYNPIIIYYKNNE